MEGLVQEVLAAWREAERVVAESTAGPERERATVAAIRLRELYYALIDEPDLQDPEALRAAIDRYRVRQTTET